jgi:hypothetical protein
MKRSMVVLAALLTTASVAGRAQSTAERLFPPVERYAAVNPVWFDHVYAPSLMSDNDGVVESVIAQSVAAKMAMPSGAFDQIREGLGRLAVNGRTPAIRVKAYMAGLVLENPAIFSGTDCACFTTTNQLFASLTSRIQQLVLSAHSAKYVRER